MTTKETTEAVEAAFKGGKKKGGPPRDFVQLGTPDLVAWFKPIEGLELHGKLLGAFSITQINRKTKREETRDILVVGLLSETYAVPADESSKEPIAYEAGTVIGLGVRHKLTPLLNYVEHKGEFWMVCEEEKDIGGGQTMWTFDLRIHPKAVKSAPPERENRASADVAGSDNIPF